MTIDLRHLFLAVTLCAPAAVAQEPRLLLDLNRTPAPPPSSNPSAYGFVGDVAYFSAQTHALGYELYRTDGSAARTHLVRDLLPGVASGAPSGFVARGNDVLFLGRRNDGLDVWRTDGTANGTVPLAAVPELRAGTAVASTTLGSVALFLVEVVGSGHFLVRSDGTQAGTALIGSFGGGNLRATAAAGGSWFFSTGDQLVRTDGTVAGTQTIHLNLSPHAMAQFGNSLFFASGTGLWRTIGTSIGTLQVYPTTAMSGGVYAVNGRLVAPAGNDLLVSDGTLAGTSVLRTFASRIGGGLWATAGGAVYFVADDGVSGQELWRTDGTVPGTRLVADLSPGAAHSTFTAMVALGARVLFGWAGPGQGTELCVSDGTAAGTVCFDLEPGVAGSEPYAIVADAAGNRAVFSAVRGAIGREPFVTDGTAAGTFPLADLATSPPRTEGSRPGRFATLGAATFFYADDGANGSEPHITDGTAAGTRALLDVYPGPVGSRPTFLDAPVVAGGKVFFAADSLAAGTELWVTDGTTAGTRMVADLAPGAAHSNPQHLTRLDERRVLFMASTPALGEELWVSDGTAAGTIPLEISPGPVGSFPSNFAVVGARALFMAFDRNNGNELWVTDGTIAGTHLLLDVVPGLLGSNPVAVPHAGAVYFLVNNGPQVGLWRTDGTTAGTVLAVSLPLAPGTTLMGRLTSARGLLYFARDDGSNGIEPWVSDGTAAGTRRLADIAPGAVGSSPGDFAAIDNGVVFETEGYGTWRTDGTAASTQPIVDWGNSFANFVAGSRSVWSVAPPSTWHTDGTVAGTRALPGLTASGAAFAVLGGKLLAALDDGVHGEELWLVDEAARAVRIGQGCGGAFRAPQLAANDPVLGNQLALVGSDVVPGAPAVLVLGAVASAPALLPGTACALYVDAAAFVVVPAATLGTRFDAFLAVPGSTALDGARLMAQAVSVNAGSALGLDLSNGVALTLGAR